MQAGDLALHRAHQPRGDGQAHAQPVIPAPVAFAAVKEGLEHMRQSRRGNDRTGVGHADQQARTALVAYHGLALQGDRSGFGAVHRVFQQAVDHAAQPGGVGRHGGLIGQGHAQFQPLCLGDRAGGLGGGPQQIDGVEGFDRHRHVFHRDL